MTTSPTRRKPDVLRVRQRLGKYRIVRRLGEGGFASVYEAFDTIEGIAVALKVPRQHLVDDDLLAEFRNEIRIATHLDHPGLLSLKNADVIEGRLVLAFPLGERTLADRLRSRLARGRALEWIEGIVDAVAHAHARGVIHCDIKPENLILLSGQRLVLSDFGISKLAQRTILGSGSGTVGYAAPEQMMGRPSKRSDVFSLGLVAWRMLSGSLPEWPFTWPPAGHERLRRTVHPDLIAWLRRAIEVEPRKRFRDAGHMHAALARVLPHALEPSRNGRRRGAPTTRRGTVPGARRADWRAVRERQFRREHGKVLGLRHDCEGCGGPISEPMTACPWCGRRRAVHRGDSAFERRCPRCRRGMKGDWRFCAWCYGPGLEPSTTRVLKDARYERRCANPACERKQVLPFSRYCPWCRHKLHRPWPVPGSRARCGGCGWGVVEGYWEHCPWCARALPAKGRRG